MTEQYIRYAAMFIIIMMAVIDDYRRFKVSNRIIIAGMVIGVVINMGSLMYGGDVRGYIYGGMAGFAIMYMVYTLYGTRYHSSRNCTELKRNIQKVSKDSVSDRRLCEKCQE